MATRTKAPSKAASASVQVRGSVQPLSSKVPAGLRTTDIPGVYRNRHGVQVDERGVMLSFAQLKEQDRARFADVVGEEEEVDSPAKLLRAVALDPRRPLAERVHAAVKAAPYFDQKKPIQLEGGDPDKPVKVLSEAKLANLGDSDLEALALLLAKVEGQGQ